MTENWVVLGDSLTEGVGFRRHSFVSELVSLMRESDSMRVTLVRLRAVDGASAFVKFGYAADIDEDPRPAGRRIWIWNLASEGTTIETDHARLPLVQTLRPSLVIVFRGALDSIVRPSAVYDNGWPFWVPAAWRRYAATDPRCYFSTTWWRRIKQQGIDGIKQKVRLRMLEKTAGAPLCTAASIATHASQLFASLKAFVPRVVVCGMLPVSDRTFPGSAAQFQEVSGRLRAAADENDCEFLDWGSEFARRAPGNDLGSWFYRDGFHPNQAGSVVLAQIIREKLFANQQQ
jgi:lysophospholipase L1-like esterase